MDNKRHTMPPQFNNKVMIGDNEILGRIDEGAFSVVFQGYNHRLMKRVALKVMK